VIWRAKQAQVTGEQGWCCLARLTAFQLPCYNLPEGEGCRSGLASSTHSNHAQVSENACSIRSPMTTARAFIDGDMLQLQLALQCLLVLTDLHTFCSCPPLRRISLRNVAGAARGQEAQKGGKRIAKGTPDEFVCMIHFTQTQTHVLLTGLVNIPCGKVYIKQPPHHRASIIMKMGGKGYISKDKDTTKNVGIADSSKTSQARRR